MCREEETCQSATQVEEMRHQKLMMSVVMMIFMLRSIP